ncbi:MAG: hypothetical protein JW909_04870 [Planctomycetes bacterium]|nr:hypothetical protein [Planctomycetota bacterium]
MSNKGILGRASYRVEGDRLVIRGRLDWPLDLTFDLCLRDLMENSTAMALVMDLSGVSRITSPYIGVIAAAAEELAAGGRTLKILADEPIARTLASAGIPELADIEPDN